MPDSLTKRRVDDATVAALIREAFGPAARIARCGELNDGYFNTAFRILLDDGRDVVLKIAPAPGTALLTYERDIMRAEAVFFREAAASGVPLPEVLYEGFGRTGLDGDFIVLSALDGVCWHTYRDELTEQDDTALHTELGNVFARLHTTTNAAGLFGYPAVPELSAPSWPEAFAAMLDGLLRDARRFDVTLPLPAPYLADLAAANSASLAEITAPALVHFDLSPGNIFISAPGGGTPSRITGLIDGERMIWGDPLMEFVGMDIFGRADRHPDVVAGYLGAGGRIARDEAADRRLALYHLYMHLLLLIEMAPRCYTDPEYLELFTSECPKRVLAAAEQLG